MIQVVELYNNQEQIKNQTTPQVNPSGAKDAAALQEELFY